MSDATPLSTGSASLAPKAHPAVRKKKRTWPQWLIASVVLLGIAAFVVHYVRSRPPPKPRYQTQAVDRGRIASKVTATGALSALVTVQVGAQVSGRIESIRVDFNSPVKKGQVIATIDPQLFQAAVAQASANAASANANLEKAKAQAMEADRQYARTQALHAQGLSGQAEVDAAQASALVAKTTVSSAQASVAQAAAALNQAQVNLKYATILSPIDGVVISRSVDVGQTVAAAMQAPTLFTIAQDLTKMQVDTNVAEGDVGKIKPEMKVGFTVDAFPGKRFEGKVRQVRDAPQTVQNVVTYDAVIDVDNSERLLKPGMTATVTFTSAERADVLRIPNAALRYRPEMAAGPTPGGGPTGTKPTGGNRSEGRAVWVLRDGNPAKVDVTLGISDGSVTELVKGDLREGDALITEVISEGGSSSAPAGGGMGGGMGGGGTRRGM
ncbi:MAG: efflux RND transporter periplasmic adaptor subunit [Polyangiaceae bacterium]